MLNRDQSGWPKLVAPPVTKTPSALAGPGVSSPTARTRSLVTPVSASTLSKESTSARCIAPNRNEVSRMPGATPIVRTSSGCKKPRNASSSASGAMVTPNTAITMAVGRSASSRLIGVSRCGTLMKAPISAMAKAYELGLAGTFINYLYPAYLGVAKRIFLTHDGNAGAAEFQKLLDHPGIAQNFVTQALAHLQIGRDLRDGW